MAFCVLQTAATTAKVGDAMAKANAAMAAMGATNDPKKVAQTMQEFQKESAKMDMGQEMMDDTLDGVFDDDEVEGETDDLMNQASVLFISLSRTNNIIVGPQAAAPGLCIVAAIVWGARPSVTAGTA